jgi:hypothetical protein
MEPQKATNENKLKSTASHIISKATAKWLSKRNAAILQVKLKRQLNINWTNKWEVKAVVTTAQSAGLLQYDVKVLKVNN